MWAALLLGVTLSTHKARAQTDADAPEEILPPPVPFAVINAAGVDRLLSDAQYVFEAAERPELMDWFNEGLGMIGDLDGVDRTRPFGLMLFLDPGAPPVPFPVFYVPVDNERRLLDTLSLRGMQWKKSGTSDSRYETVGAPGMHLLFSGGYAFLLRRGDWILDEELPDPVSEYEPLSDRYDIAASLRMGAIPVGIRTVFLGFLRSSMQADLQQRDNEPDAAYRIRRANGMNMLETLEQLLMQGDEIRIGWDASREEQTGVLEIVVNALPDSDFAEHLESFGSTTSMFHAMSGDSQPLTFIGAWTLNERQQKAYEQYLLAGRERLETQLGDQQPVAAVEGMFEALSATLKAGVVDGFIQFAAPKPQAFVVRGAVKLQGSQSFGASLAAFLGQMQANPDVGSVAMNLDSHQGVMIHRIGSKDEGTGDEEQRLFGGEPSLYIGAGPQAVWFAIGTEHALPQLKQAIDIVRSSAGQPPGPGAGAAPIQLISRMNAWLTLPPRDHGDRGPSTFRLLSDEAFGGEDDALRLDVRPRETGLRVRIQLDEGYLRLLGLAIGRQYDRTQL